MTSTLRLPQRTSTNLNAKSSRGLNLPPTLYDLGFNDFTELREGFVQVPSGFKIEGSRFKAWGFRT